MNKRMNMSIGFACARTLAAGLLIYSGYAIGAAQTAQLEVTGSYVDSAPAEVTITSSPMRFDLANVNTVSTASINVTAPAGLTCKLLLDGGRYFATNLRYMDILTIETFARDYYLPRWPYNLYTDSDRTLVWGDEGATTPASWVNTTWTSSGGVRTFRVYGRAYGQTLEASTVDLVNRIQSEGGVYSDTVTITVAY